MSLKAIFSFAVLSIFASACTVRSLPIQAPASVRQAGTPTLTATAPKSTAADESVVLRELIVRLVPLGMFGQTEEAKPEVTLNRLPALFPPELKLPEGVRVLGGISQGQTSARAALDAPQSPKDAVAALKSSLLVNNWTEPPQMMPGGFQPGLTISTTTAFLCKSKEGPSLSISAQPATGRVGAEIQLSVDILTNTPGEFTFCNQPEQPIAYAPPTLPTMITPDGVRAQGNGSSGSNDWYSSYTTLLTDRPVVELRTHFDQQLKDAAWTPQAQGADGPMAWSTWQFKDKQGKAQTGLLLVIAQDRDGKPTRNVQLQISMN